MGDRAASGGASAGVLLAAVLPTAVLPMAVLPTVVPAALLATAPVQEHRWAEIAWKDGCMGCNDGVRAFLARPGPLQARM